MVVKKKCIDLVKQVEDYLNNTPKEVIQKEIEEIESLNNIGPTVDEWLKSRNEIMERIENFVTEFKNKLHEGVVAFSYQKKDGSTREAHGTLKNEILKENNAEPKGTGKEVSDDIIRYFDVDKNAWRSFSVYSFIEYI